MKKLPVTINLEMSVPDASAESDDVLDDILDVVASDDVAYGFVTH